MAKRAPQPTRLCVEGTTNPHLARSNRASRCTPHHDAWRRYLTNRSKLEAKVQQGKARKADLKQLRTTFEAERDLITATAQPAPAAPGTAPRARTRADEAATRLAAQALAAKQRYDTALTRGRDARTRAAAADAFIRAITKAIATYHFMINTRDPD
jgi:hypothetical protein